MGLPLEISPCPILEAAFEVRFAPLTHPSAVFGMAYKVLQESHPSTVTTLPILQLSEEWRDQDPGLRYKPHHQISNDRFAVQIGPRVLIIACKMPYPGWKHFSEEIYNSIAAVVETDAISSVERIGLRYINFFEGDVTDRLTFDIQTIEKYDVVHKSMGMVVKQEDILSNLTIDNGPRGNLSDGRKGTVIDIDTFQFKKSTSREWDYQHDIEALHSNEKALFFSALQPEFIDKLNAKYEQQ